MAEQLAGVTAGACLSSVSSGAATPGPSQLRSLWSSPPQVSIRLDGENKAVEYNAVGAVKDAVRVVFRGPRVSDLFDREWHKIALSIQAQNVTLYVDCVLVHTLPIEERENIDIQGKTVIGKRLYDSVPIDVSTGGASQCPPHLPVPYQFVTLDCLRREGADSGLPGRDPESPLPTRLFVRNSFSYSAV